MKHMPKNCFVEILLFLQALCACTLITSSVYSASFYSVFHNSSFMPYVSVSAFVLSYILLRACLRTQGLLLCLLLNTLGVSMMGCQIAVWLCATDDTDTFKRGKLAIALGCMSLLVSFITIQFVWLHYYWQQNEGAVNTIVMRIITQSTVIVCFIFGASIVVIDDRVWEWRYAYAILFTVLISAYLNGFTAFFHLQNNKNNASAATVCAEIILQPILFIEEWLVVVVSQGSK